MTATTTIGMHEGAAPGQTADWPLLPGEVILWQGRPEPGLHLGMRHLLRLLGGGFGLMLFLWLVQRLNLQVAPFWDVWVIVLTVFFASIPLDILRAAWLRGRSRYALTDRRALIATDLPLYGERLRAIPIGPETPVEFLRGRRLSSLTFPPLHRGRNPLPAAPAGFERIADGEAVLALVGRIQAARP